jgi:hypothetical protein
MFEQVKYGAVTKKSPSLSVRGRFSLTRPDLSTTVREGSPISIGRVATSDALEQLIILGHGAVRVSARMLRQEVEAAEGEIAKLLERYR